MKCSKFSAPKTAVLFHVLAQIELLISAKCLFFSTFESFARQKVIIVVVLFAPFFPACECKWIIIIIFHRRTQTGGNKKRNVKHNFPPNHHNNCSAHVSVDGRTLWKGWKGWFSILCQQFPRNYEYPSHTRAHPEFICVVFGQNDAQWLVEKNEIISMDEADGAALKDECSQNFFLGKRCEAFTLCAAPLSWVPRSYLFDFYW
jgi:hypothetical protein